MNCKIFSAFFLLIFFAAFDFAFACKCPPISHDDALKQADIVFEGKMTLVRYEAVKHVRFQTPFYSEGDYYDAATFSVSKKIKGFDRENFQDPADWARHFFKKDSINVTTPSSSASCGLMFNRFDTGKTYKIYGLKRNGKITLYSCQVPSEIYAMYY